MNSELNMDNAIIVRVGFAASELPTILLPPKTNKLENPCTCQIYQRHYPLE